MGRVAVGMSRHYQKLSPQARNDFFEYMVRFARKGGGRTGFIALSRIAAIAKLSNDAALQSKFIDRLEPSLMAEVAAFYHSTAEKQLYRDRLLGSILGDKE
jgi:hypothetical protein